MDNPFLAKTKDKETIVEHTDKLYKNFIQLKEIYPNIKHLDWDILELACLYHDLGKMNTMFQKKLLRKLKEDDDLDNEIYKTHNIEEIPHGYLSPAFLSKKELKNKYDVDELRILYQSIYYHHSRRKLNNSELLKIVIKEDLARYWDDFKYEKITKVKKLNSSYVKYTTSGRIPDPYDTEDIINQFIMTKGLLNKIDYAASSDVEVEVINDSLFEKTAGYFRVEGYKCNDLQKYMIKYRDDNNVVVASTGVGKTEAALFWIGNNKGFFTLPLKVSINAIYDRVIKEIGFEKEKTALLHSDTMSEYLKRTKEEEKKDKDELEMDMDYYGKTKQLSLPLTVCTLDQLIGFIFKYEGYEMKLATLAYSKLVIDEIQMYSADLVAYLIVALKHITDMGGKFSIITATLPDIFVDFMRGEGIPFRLAEKKYLKENEKGEIQLRHRVKVLEEDIDVKRIRENYQNKKVLVIVNTVMKAQELYGKLKDLETEVNLFHSRFIKRDRSEKEDRILKMGEKENKETGIWITTQVVEASLNIDFDVLYTELSDICGLLQRMGRVYRSRDLAGEITNVFVYTGKKFTSGINNGRKSIVDVEIFRSSKEAIKGFDDKDLNEAEKMKLVEEVYSKEKLKDSYYYKQIKKTINYAKNIKEYEVDKKDVKLRDIYNQPVIPKNIYNMEKDMILEQIKIIEESKDFKVKQIAKDKIKEIVVDIPLYEYDYAKSNNLILGEVVELDKFNRIPIIDYEYSFDEGLMRKKGKDFNPDTQFM